MSHSLRFERGTGFLETLDLNEQVVNWVYHLASDSWQPATAERRWSTLQQAPFADVPETFELMIQGETKTDIMDAYRALIVWLDSARVLTRYGDEQSETPIRFVVQLDDSPNEWQSLVVVNEGDPPCVEFSSGFLNNQNQLLQRNVVVRFNHRMLTTTEQEASQSSQTVGTAVSLSFGGDPLDAPSPTNIEITGAGWNTGTGSLRPDSGAVIVSYGEPTILQAGSASGSDWSSVADSSNAASSNILRFTPSVTTRRDLSQGSTTLPKTFLAFAEVRNNTANKEYGLYLSFSRRDAGGDPLFTAKTRTAIVKANKTGVVQLIGLGLVQCPQTPTDWQISLQASSTGGTLDLDRIYLVPYTPETAVVAFGAMTGFVTTPTELVIDTRWLNHPDGLQCRVQSAGDASSSVPFSAFDALQSPWTENTSITVLFLAYPATGGWSLHSGGTRLSGLTISASRRPSAIVAW